MEWWVWILAGLLLLVGELITPGGFYIAFFGIGAIVVGALAALQIAGPVWVQFGLFSAVSVLALWLFREKLLRLSQGPDRGQVDSLIGETAVTLEGIPLNGIGKAEMRGSSWSARNIGEKPLARGERCKVERVEGLMIFVRAEQS
jgi:membrane protein implicated in regulation of membrane protease activity